MSSGSIIAVAAPHGPLPPSICHFASRARPHECSLATGPRRSKSLATQNNSATLRCGDRGIRVGRLGFFKPLETTGLIRFGLKRNTPGKWLRSSRPIGRRKPCRQPGAAAGHDSVTILRAEIEVPVNGPSTVASANSLRHADRTDNPMGTVPIWKQWLIIAACILVSPAIVFALVCGFGWLVFRRLWPRNPRVARQSTP